MASDFRKLGLVIRELEEGPADEIIYYLLGPRRKEGLTRDFLDCLDRELERRPEVRSLLRGGAKEGPDRGQT